MQCRCKPQAQSTFSISRVLVTSSNPGIRNAGLNSASLPDAAPEPRPGRVSEAPELLGAGVALLVGQCVLDGYPKRAKSHRWQNGGSRPNREDHGHSGARWLVLTTAIP